MNYIKKSIFNLVTVFQMTQISTDLRYSDEMRFYVK